MAEILEIITEGDERLRQRSVEIGLSEIADNDFQSFIDKMARTMIKKDGVGLAAPQVANNIRLVIVNTPKGPKCLINPMILKRSWAKELGEEGCLSVPDVYGLVKRHKKVIAKFLDREGNEKKVEAKGIFARVLQHEIDHLDGILFIDKARDIKRIK